MKPLVKLRLSLTLVFAVLAAACASTSLRPTQTSRPLAGVWEGRLQMPVMNKRIVVRLFTQEQAIKGTLDAPTSLSTGFPLQNLAVEAGALHFDIPMNEREFPGWQHLPLSIPRTSRESMKLKFSGKIEGDLIQGSITGVPFPAAFFLKRVNPAVASPGAKSSPGEWTPRERAAWPTREWKTASPATVGIDAQRLAAAERLILEKLPEARSLLVIRDGRLVFEKYFRGSSATDDLNVKSVTKSVTSALVGIALREGLLRSLDEKASDHLPEYFVAQTDARKRQITLRHLLTMTAGFEWEENGPVTAAWMRSANYAQFAVDLPLVADPGEVHNYNTAVSHLLSAILARRSGMTTLEFARKHLFGPLGMEVRRWDDDPQGVNEGGSELYLSARDLARFGFLYLNAGRWEKREIVPAAWVHESTRPHTAKDPIWADYGYQWWVGQDDDLPAFAALGYGGQILHIVPALDLVVVMTSTVSDPRNDGQGFINEHILPAVTTRTEYRGT